jgi:ABC-type Fe3+/spermidine/putrescine transport system ATPase subunit
VTVLEIRSLDVSLGGTPILHEIDLSVEHGEAVALLGPSGSGKTTLLYALAGFVTPTAGTIEIDGRQVTSPDGGVSPENRSIGFVFQNYALWPHLSALQTVAYPMERAGKTIAQAHPAAEDLLKMMGIGDLGGRKPSELSGGQQQRVGVARALARHAALYLLDEPTAHLDAALRSELQRELAIRMTDNGAAAVYATHDASEAMAIADRVVLMREGRIVQVGTPTEVYDRPVDLWAARLTGPAWEIDGKAVGTAGRVLIRPDWIEPGEGLDGTVGDAWFRGSFTDYRIQSAAGALEMRRFGSPEWTSGDSISLSINRWWSAME